MVILILSFFIPLKRFLRLWPRAFQTIRFRSLRSAPWLLLSPIANLVREVLAKAASALLLASLHSRYRRWFAGLANWRTCLPTMGLMGRGWPNVPIMIRTRLSEKGIFSYRDGLGIVVDAPEEAE